MNEFKDVLPAPPSASREFPRGDKLGVFAEVYDNDVQDAAPRRHHQRRCWPTTARSCTRRRTTRKSEELQGTTGGYGYTTKIPLAGSPPRPLRPAADGDVAARQAGAGHARSRVPRAMSRLTTIARGDDSHVAEPRRVAAGTEQEWRALWATHAGPVAVAPAVDLAAVTVAAAFAGEKPSAGHSDRHHGRGRGRCADHARRRRARPRPRHGRGRDHHVALSHRRRAEGPRGDVGHRGSEVGGRGSGIGIGDRGSGPEVGKEPRAVFRPPTSDPRPPVLDRPGAADRLGPRLPRGAILGRPRPCRGVDQPGRALSRLAVDRRPRRARAGGHRQLHPGVLAVFVSATAVSVMVAVATVIWIVLAIVWLICLWKAWSGERWKLPLAGDYAERFATRPSLFRGIRPPDPFTRSRALRPRLFLQHPVDEATAIEPSPTADATRLTLPPRTSPTAKTPGRLVSSRCGARAQRPLRGRQIVGREIRAGLDEALGVERDAAVEPARVGRRRRS